MTTKNDTVKREDDASKEVSHVALKPTVIEEQKTQEESKTNNSLDVLTGVKSFPTLFNPVTTYIQNFQKTFIPIYESTKLVTEQLSAVTSFTDSLLQIQTAFSQFAFNYKNIIADALKSVGVFTELTKRFQEFREEEKVALLETGWIICPSLMEIPYDALLRAVVRYKQGDKGRALSLTLREFYGYKNDWDYLGKTIDGWNKHSLFTKQRMKIIRDCYWAHQNKKYTVSIPALLPIIEGIASDFCKRKKLKIPESKTTEKAKEVVKLLESQGEGYTAEILLGFIENQLYVHTSRFKTSKNKKLLNRHGVLHGYYSGYSDATRSLKCFMVLDVLSCLSI